MVKLPCEWYTKWLRSFASVVFRRGSSSEVVTVLNSQVSKNSNFELATFVMVLCQAYRRTFSVVAVSYPSVDIYEYDRTERCSSRLPCKANPDQRNALHVSVFSQFLLFRSFIHSRLSRVDVKQTTNSSVGLVFSMIIPINILSNTVVTL